MEINYTDIGKRIQTRRVKLSITQEKLAETIDLTVGHLSGIENGKTKFSFGSMIRIANALEISLDELACGSLMLGRPIIQNEFSELLADCSPEEASIILDTAKAMKKSMKAKKNGEA